MKIWMNAMVNIERFVAAQESSYLTALSEIKPGWKRSHWMWYIFPHIQGLGIRETMKRYAVKEMHEATAYLKHPVLGKSLVEISTALLALPENNPWMIFGSPDDMKLLSCMTLFSEIELSHPVFQKGLQSQQRSGHHSDTELRIIIWSCWMVSRSPYIFFCKVMA